jgi:hypothetical protein
MQLAKLLRNIFNGADYAYSFNGQYIVPNILTSIKKRGKLGQPSRTRCPLVERHHELNTPMPTVSMKMFFFPVLFLFMTVCSANAMVWPGENSGVAHTEIQTRAPLTGENNIAIEAFGEMPISMVDGSNAAVSPHAPLPIDQYLARDDKNDNIISSLLREAFREVTGCVVNLDAKDDMVTTLEVTLGIRG